MSISEGRKRLGQLSNTHIITKSAEKIFKKDLKRRNKTRFLITIRNAPELEERAFLDKKLPGAITKDIFNFSS